MLDYLLGLLDIQQTPQPSQDKPGFRQVNVDAFTDEFDDRATEQFFEDVKALIVLTPQAVEDNALAASRGDHEARWLLVLASLEIIIKLAKQFEDPQTPFLDLVQEGVLAVYDLASKRDPRTSRVPFLQAANLHVFWALNRFRTGTLSSASLSTSAAEASLKLIRHGSQLWDPKQKQSKVASHFVDTASLTRAFPHLSCVLPPLSLDTLTDEYKSPVLSQLWQVIDYLQEREWSHDAVKHIDLEYDPPHQLIADPIELVIDLVDRQLLMKHVRSALKKLRPSERLVITKYYGLSDDSTPTLTFQQIADLLGVSRQRAHQLHNRAMKRLKRLLSQIRQPMP